MKTIRTILGTLAVIVLGYGLVAVITFRGNSAFLQRTLYQVFAQSYFVTLVLGIAFLLIAIILTVALMSLRDDEREELQEKEEEAFELSDELDDEDDEEENPSARAKLGEFRRPSRPQREIPAEDAPSVPGEDDVPAFLKSSVNSRPRVKEKPAADVPSVESIFDDLEEEPAVQPKQKSARHCVFCNAVIKDESKFCPSCGKHL